MQCLTKGCGVPECFWAQRERQKGKEKGKQRENSLGVYVKKENFLSQILKNSTEVLPVKSVGLDFFGSWVRLMLACTRQYPANKRKDKGYFKVCAFYKYKTKKSNSNRKQTSQH